MVGYCFTGSWEDTLREQTYRETCLWDVWWTPAPIQKSPRKKLATSLTWHLDLEKHTITEQAQPESNWTGIILDEMTSILKIDPDWIEPTKPDPMTHFPGHPLLSFIKFTDIRLHKDMIKTVQNILDKWHANFLKFYLLFATWKLKKEKEN